MGVTDGIRTATPYYNAYIYVFILYAIYWRSILCYIIISRYDFRDKSGL